MSPVFFGVLMSPVDLGALMFDGACAAWGVLMSPARADDEIIKVNAAMQISERKLFMLYIS